MEKSKVYFSDMRALPGTNLQEKCGGKSGYPHAAGKTGKTD